MKKISKKYTFVVGVLSFGGCLGSSNPLPSCFHGGEGISSILQEGNNRVETLPALPYSSSLLPRGGEVPYLSGDGGEGAGKGSPPLLPGSLQDMSVCRLGIFCMQLCGKPLGTGPVCRPAAVCGQTSKPTHLLLVIKMIF